MFLTSDEYVSGNLDKVHDLRLQIVGLLEQDEIYRVAWSHKFSQIFNQHYKSWPSSAPKKAQRFFEVLQERSEQTRDSAHYTEKFIDSLNAFGVPSIESLVTYTRQHKGSITLSDRYKSETINGVEDSS